MTKQTIKLTGSDGHFMTKNGNNITNVMKIIKNYMIYVPKFDREMFFIVFYLLYFIIIIILYFNFFVRSLISRKMYEVICM